MGCSQMFPETQDHLGQVQGLRQPAVGREQGCPQSLTFGQGCCKIVVMHEKLDCFKVFEDI